jgi:enoyl-CoA hydratase/carnithine racemase
MEALMHAKTEKAQIRVTRLSSTYWRVTFDNPPLNVMGPRFVREFREIIAAVEADGTSGSWSSKAPSKDFSSITAISTPI